MVGRKENGQILFGDRSEKPKQKNLFDAKTQLQKIYVAVKGLIRMAVISKHLGNN